MVLQNYAVLISHRITHVSDTCKNVAKYKDAEGMQHFYNRWRHVLQRY